MSFDGWLEANDALMKVALPGYEAQPGESGVIHSEGKLEDAAKALNLPLSIMSTKPCQTEAETWAYRCTCSFQLIQDKNDHKFMYAMRHKQLPILLGADFFPIATMRIQVAMRKLLELLNGESVCPALCRDLTSVSFASSWRQGPSTDCFVTLYYDQPLDQDEDDWKLQALEVCHRANLTQLLGRSRKRVVPVKGINKGGSIRDMIWFARQNMNFLTSLDNDYRNELFEGESVPVHYMKPENAFFHPNGNVMLQALQWMLVRLAGIVQLMEKPVRLLELYCGCGAHTVALSRAALLDVIVAVEMDKRLVEACEKNCRKNGCYRSPDQWEATAEQEFYAKATTNTATTSGKNPTPVFVFEGDAGEWAQKSLHARNRKLQSPSRSIFARKSLWYNHNYDILLVDPPRAGLDEKVCQMAIDGPFQHVLYISCGRDALKRDIKRLGNHFEVIECLLLDLFPRTSAVESLVHLSRRST